jgi:hypothetical protein
MRGHSAPNLWRIMRAVDPHDVHAVRKQLADERVIIRRLTGHCDHDSDDAMRRRRPEQRFGMDRQHRPSFGETDDIGCELHFVLPPREVPQYTQHGVQRPHRVRFSSSQRGET